MDPVFAPVLIALGYGTAEVLRAFAGWIARRDARKRADSGAPPPASKYCDHGYRKCPTCSVMPPGDSIQPPSASPLPPVSS